MAGLQTFSKVDEQEFNVDGDTIVRVNFRGDDLFACCKGERLRLVDGVAAADVEE